MQVPLTPLEQGTFQIALFLDFFRNVLRQYLAICKSNFFQYCLFFQSTTCLENRFQKQYVKCEPELQNRSKFLITMCQKQIDICKNQQYTFLVIFYSTTVVFSQTLKKFLKEGKSCWKKKLLIEKFIEGLLKKKMLSKLLNEKFVRRKLITVKVSVVQYAFLVFCYFSFCYRYFFLDPEHVR